MNNLNNSIKNSNSIPHKKVKKRYKLNKILIIKLDHDNNKEFIKLKNIGIIEKIIGLFNSKLKMKIFKILLAKSNNKLAYLENININ